MSPCRSLSKLYLLLRWSPTCTPFLCRSLTGATKWAPVALWAEIRSLQKLLAPRPEKSKIQHEIDFFFKRTRSGRGSNVWAIQRFQKTYLEISWDYPFKLVIDRVASSAEITNPPRRNLELIAKLGSTVVQFLCCGEAFPSQTLEEVPRPLLQSGHTTYQSHILAVNLNFNLGQL
jgi:hypothetical protein